MFRNLSLRIRLSLAFLLIAALVAGVSVYQIRSANRFNGLFADLIQNDFERLNKLKDIRLKAAELRYESLHSQLEGSAGLADLTEARSNLESIGNTIKRLETEYFKYLEEDDRQVNVERITNITEKSDRVMQDAIALLSVNVNSPAFRVQEEAFDKSIAELSLLIDEAVTAKRKSIENENAEVSNTVIGLIRVNIILASGTVVVAVLLGLITANSLAGSIAKLRRGAGRIASGDFSQPIEVNSRDEVGQLAEQFNTMADRLRESYARLALERERDETLLESMNDGLIALDDAGKIVMVNNSVINLMDLSSRTDLEGKSVDSAVTLFDDKDKPLKVGYNPAKASLIEERVISETFTCHRRDGRKTLIQATMSPVVVEGKPTGVIMLVRDVTKEKEIDRMKTEFISLASHQLRTPLSAIKWFSEMLVNGDAGKLNADQLEFAQNVADSTERMIDLVNSLLNISRIESGRIMIVPKPTDLEELVRGIVNDLKAKIEERKQTLVVSIHKELPKVNLDTRMIGQVYLNLLTNAIKYTPKGGEISVFVSRKGDELVSQVTDNGYGIPKAEQAKMFQKFFRAANVAKFETDGTGLGLYLIKAIVESSGGKIWFESEEGKGTTFWFSLPISGMKAKEGEVTLDV